MMRSVAILLALLLAGCGILPTEEDETAKLSAEQIYQSAKESLNDGAYDKSIKLFEKLEARYPYGRHAQQAQMEIAYAHYKLGEVVSAVAAADRFLKLHPNHVNADYMYYLKGLAYFNEESGLTSWLANQDLSERDPRSLQDSFSAFKELTTRYPQSRYAPDAAARMNYLVNALASGEVHVARYYYKKGAYVAAVNRAQNALKSYPNAPATEEALFLLVKSYDAMGLNDLRDDADRILQKNFPKSSYVAKGDGSKAWWKFW